VSYPSFKGGASPVPPAFTADGFIWELRAGSRQPHPAPLVKEWATRYPTLPLGGVIGNIPIFGMGFGVFKLNHPPALKGEVLQATAI